MPINHTTMRISSLLLLLFAFAFVSCEDDEDPFVDGDIDLAVNFRAEFGDRDLAVQSETYDYPGGDQLKMQLFQYYVSDLELLPADGSAPVRLSEIELIRYGSATEDNVETRTFTVPTGEYAGLRFGLGVKPSLNALDPNNFSATDPLNENEFWNPTARYVFAKIEANADLEPNGIFNAPVTLHMGSNALYQVVTLNESFTLRGGNTAELDVVADVLEALGGAASTYDIGVEANRRVHGGNQALAAGVFSDLAGQFTLEQISRARPGRTLPAFTLRKLRPGATPPATGGAGSLRLHPVSREQPYHPGGPRAGPPFVFRPHPFGRFYH